MIPVLIGLGLIQTPLHDPLQFAGTITISCLCFAILGTLFSASPTDNPASIMTISSLVHLRLIFLSGVFQPVVAALSLLTCTTELVRGAFGQEVIVPVWLCLVVLTGFCAALWVSAITTHPRNMARRLFL